MGERNFTVVPKFIYPLNFMNFKKNSFTLIEAIIIIAIVAVAGSVVFANKNSSQKYYKVLDAAKKLEMDIRRIQNHTIGSVPHNSGASGTVPCSRGLSFSQGGGQYSAGYETMLLSSQLCDVDYIFGTEKAQEDEILNESKNFSEDNNIIAGSLEIDGVSASSVSLIFSPPDMQTFINGNTGKKLEIALKYSGESCPSKFCRKIIVNSFGQAVIE